jgi:hypothetical protein
MGQIACMGELKDVYKTSFRNNGREQSLGKPRVDVWVTLK